MLCNLVSPPPGTGFHESKGRSNGQDTVLNRILLIRTSHPSLTRREAGDKRLRLDFLVSTAFITLVSLGLEPVLFNLKSCITFTHNPLPQVSWNQGQVSGRVLDAEFHSSGLLVGVDHQESM